MGQESVQRLIDRWVNDPEFRTEIRSNPEETVRQAGEDLSSEEWEAFRKIDWDMTDEQLEERASKLFA